jgi:ABC-type glutathione transport system ATPase component
MQSLLQVRDLSVSYVSTDHKLTDALNGVNFEIARGEAVGLLGESGCGKTTLGLTLLGLLPGNGCVKTGSIKFREIDLLGLQESQLQRVRGDWISMVYQEPGMSLNPVLRVVDQIAEVLRAHGSLSRTRAKEDARALLGQVGLAPTTGIGEAYPHQLSGGQRQRVVIAQAIACRPALIIADEPTTALDAVTQSAILTLLKSLQTELRMALLLITHDPAVLEQVVDRILVMYAGRVVEVGSTGDVLQRPLHPYAQRLLRARSFGTEHKNPLQFLPVIPGEPLDVAPVPARYALEPRPDGRRICRTYRPRESRRRESGRVVGINYAG